MGGRNVGAHYFQAHTQSNFRDLDIVGAGPIVRETSAVFDRFWNGPWSVPMADIVNTTYTEDDFAGNPGFYSFPELDPGFYYAVFDVANLPGGYVPTFPDVGSDESVDSDADPATGRWLAERFPGRLWVGVEQHRTTERLCTVTTF